MYNIITRATGRNEQKSLYSSVIIYLISGSQIQKYFLVKTCDPYKIVLKEGNKAAFRQKLHHLRQYFFLDFSILLSFTHLL